MTLGRTLPILLATGLLSCSDVGVRQRRDPPDSGISGCGDGQVGGGEQCDGADLAGNSCTTLGFDVGTVSCDPQCRLVTSACSRLCGNGKLDPGEECDGTIGSLDCPDWGYKVCTAACRVDALHCRASAFRPGRPVPQSYGGPAIVTDLTPPGYGELVIPDEVFTRLRIYRYDIDTGFSESSLISRTDGVAPSAPFAADLDGDGRMDLAAINSDGTADRYRYVPPGEALPDGGPPTNFGRYALQHLPAPVDAGASCPSFAWLGVARVNANGAADLAALACPGSTIVSTHDAVLIHRGGANPSAPEIVPQPGIVDGTIADFDGDGVVDLLLAGQDARLVIRRGPEFAEGPTLDLPAAPLRIAAGDLDGDGDADVVMSLAGAVRILENTGRALVEPNPAIQTAPGPLAVRDLDLDGRHDIVWMSGDHLEICRNRGKFRFDFQAVPTGSGTALSLEFGDFEGDGDPDIAATLLTQPPAANTTTHVLENLVQ